VNEEDGRAVTHVCEALSDATQRLVTGGSETPRLDAELLLGHVLDLTRTQLHAHWQDALDAATAQGYADLVQRREAHEPVAYLLGQRAFYDVELKVNKHVLIPRPETEQLVEEALRWSRTQTKPLHVVDVGTGSGALALVLARHLSQARVWAVDLSRAALDVAARNLRHYGLQERVTLVQSDLLGAMAGPFDLIVANLPYIPRQDLATLQADVRDYEPRLALDGGEDGLDLIRRLLMQVPQRLAAPGLLLLEIEQRQGEAVLALLQQHLPQAETRVLCDYAGLPRVVCAALYHLVKKDDCAA
jgi:release factor glutamine methyltransferase